MQNQNRTVLSISCTYQLVAYVIVKDGELFDWDITSFKQVKSKKKANRISTYIAEQIRISDANKILVRNNNVVNWTKMFENKEHLEIEFYKLEDLKNKFGRIKNRRSLYQKALQNYEYLGECFKNHTSFSYYHFPLLDAATALVLLN